MPVKQWFKSEQAGSVLIVAPVGEMMSLSEQDLAAELRIIRDRMRHLGATNLLIDFEKVPYFGSTTLGALLELSRNVTNGVGKMALCNVSTLSREVLHITHFDTLWSIYDSRPEACASFEGQSE